MAAIYLDTETTGLRLEDGAALVEVAVVDDEGAVLLNTLVNPGRPIPSSATAIHRISDDMVADAPPATEVVARVLDLARGRTVVIYNAAFDIQFLPGLQDVAASVECCMRRHAEWRGQWSEWHDGYKWHKLTVAAKEAGHDWSGGAAHRALADAQACRTVWQWLPGAEATKKEMEGRAAARRAALELEWEIDDGWVLAFADMIAAEMAARKRAKRSVDAIDSRRLMRLRQAVEGLRPVLRAAGPTADEILAGAVIPAERETIAAVARRTGSWEVERRGWYSSGRPLLTPAFAEAMAATLRRVRIAPPWRLDTPFRPSNDVCPQRWLLP
ncbi:MAG: DNA polymerase III subunit epsilon-like 3'-5' [Rhodospirillaceae bacterium]|nr:MAG: DNA polymerase III subunit epsilon-like 3'-5' [Rhodospirillaceae bacterium]TNC98678.1 MAG: DNA polymerase III subunit epsilon-like 3'-5' exonuclease [Stygiobacter sp.]